MNNTSTEKRLKGALENLPRLLQSKAMTGFTSSTGGGFSLTRDHRSNNNLVYIRKGEGIYSQRLCFDISATGIQGELESPFLTEGLGDYFSDLTNPRSEEIQLFLTIHPEHCDFIIEVCDYLTCFVYRPSSLFNSNT